MENLSFSNTSHMNTSFANVIGGQCFVYNAIAIKICRAFAYGLLILGSVVGNSLVIAVVRRDKNTKQTLGYFIQNMAVADLLITVVYMPRMISAVFRGHEWLIDGTLGLVLCKIVPFCHHAAIFVSIQTLVVISVEKFLAVVYPLKRNITKGQAKLLIALAWIVSVAVRIPRLLALTTQRRKSAGNKLFCRTVFSPPFYTNKDAKKNLLRVSLLPLLFSSVEFGNCFEFGDNSHSEAQKSARKPYLEGAETQRSAQPKNISYAIYSDLLIHSVLVDVLHCSDCNCPQIQMSCRLFPAISGPC